MTTHRPTDKLPSILAEAVHAVAEARGYELTNVWRWTLNQAIADIRDAEAGGITYPLPPPVGWWSHLPTSALVEVRWRQSKSEARRQSGLFVAAGSARTAILVAGAVTYIRADGDFGALLRQRPIGSSWSTTLPAGLVLARVAASA